MGHVFRWGPDEPGDWGTAVVQIPVRGLREKVQEHGREAVGLPGLRIGKCGESVREQIVPGKIQKIPEFFLILHNDFVFSTLIFLYGSAGKVQRIPGGISFPYLRTEP
jgi:hypothetical protein